MNTMRHLLSLAGAGALACAAMPSDAFAHAICGARVFPVTLTLDDPGVSDEVSVPTFTYQRSGAEGGPGPSHEYDFNFEFDKRITPNLGIGLNYGWNVTQTDNAKTQTGFENLFVTPKYSVCVSPDREFIVAVGLQREFGGTGTEHTGADRFGATTPLLYFGKGLGDVPVSWLRPFAVTGQVGYTIADKALKSSSSTDPVTGIPSLAFNSGNENRFFAGASLQYSIPYLQSQVKDFGLPGFVGRLTPLLEVTWSSPATAPSALGTTWTLAPGVIYSGSWYQVAVEALIPANRAAGTNVGVIAQFHMYLDDLLPDSLGRPIFQ